MNTQLQARMDADRRTLSQLLGVLNDHLTRGKLPTVSATECGGRQKLLERVFAIEDRQAQSTARPTTAAAPSAPVTAAPAAKPDNVVPLKKAKPGPKELEKVLNTSAKKKAKPAGGDAAMAAAKAKPAVAAKPKIDAKANGAGGVKLTDIAKAIDMDDKIARAKLRRVPEADLPDTIGGNWVFAAKDVPAVKALLSGDRRKA